MQKGTKKNPVFHAVRATSGGHTNLRPDSVRCNLRDYIAQHGKRGVSVALIEQDYERPMRTAIHKLIEGGHVEPIYPKTKA